jgi:anti-sigma regulatory factor (Ser/Thr protein kinase)
MLHLELARDEGAPRRVRLALDDVKGLDPVIVDDAKLVATELVTNSVKYGGTGPVEFSVKRGRRGVVRLEVVDPGKGFLPRLRPRQPDDIGGWGLWLVERLSHRWGVAKGSAQVWCEFKTSSAGAAG